MNILTSAARINALPAQTAAYFAVVVFALGIIAGITVTLAVTR